MGRSVGAVMAGAVVWAVLWIAGNQGLLAAFPERLAAGQPVTWAGILWFLVAFSSALSVLAGWVTGRVADRSPVKHAGGLAALQLLLGIGFQTSAWALFPLWYHLVFLGLVVPMTLAGGALAARRSEGATAYA